MCRSSRHDRSRMLGIRCCVTLPLYVHREGGQRGPMGGPRGVLQSSRHLKSGVHSQRLAANRRESLMKLYVDTNGKQVTVTKDPVEKTEQNGRQKTERNTGRLMWSTQVFVL